jgi:transposase-like protein
MTISKEVLDDLLKGVERPEDLLGDAGLMKELKIKLMERMLGAELTAHLGYEEGESAPPSQTNRRNGRSATVLKGQDGELPVAIPRDRDSSFEPELVKKGQTRTCGMDDKIVGLYAAGLTVRDIQARSCRESCGNSLAARSGHVKDRCFRLRGHCASSEPGSAAMSPRTRGRWRP